jgi:hypothetical protein
LRILLWCAGGRGRKLYSWSSCILYCDKWLLSSSHLSSWLYPVRQSHTGLSSIIYFQTTSKQSNFVVTHTSHPRSSSLQCLHIFILFPHEIKTLWFCGCPLFTSFFISSPNLTWTPLDVLPLLPPSYVYTYIYVYIYIWIYVYIYVCMYECIYVYT